MHRLLCCLVAAACRPGAAPIVPTDSVRVPDAIDGEPDVWAVMQSGLQGRLDRRGVIFIDAWEDEAEEARPKIATVLCGAALETSRRAWVGDLRMRLAEQALICGAQTCVHEAAEAMDFRGEYRFEQGALRVVAHTSGPPGHITAVGLAMDRRFVAAAVAALANAPCGTDFTAYPEYDPALDGPDP